MVRFSFNFVVFATLVSRPKYNGGSCVADKVAVFTCDRVYVFDTIVMSEDPTAPVLAVSTKVPIGFSVPIVIDPV